MKPTTTPAQRATLSTNAEALRARLRKYEAMRALLDHRHRIPWKWRLRWLLQGIFRRPTPEQTLSEVEQCVDEIEAREQTELSRIP